MNNFVAAKMISNVKKSPFVHNVFNTKLNLFQIFMKKIDMDMHAWYCQWSNCSLFIRDSKNARIQIQIIISPPCFCKNLPFISRLLAYTGISPTRLLFSTIFRNFSSFSRPSFLNINANSTNTL